MPVSKPMDLSISRVDDPYRRLQYRVENYHPSTTTTKTVKTRSAPSKLGNRFNKFKSDMSYAMSTRKTTSTVTTTTTTPQKRKPIHDHDDRNIKNNIDTVSPLNNLVLESVEEEASIPIDDNDDDLQDEESTRRFWRAKLAKEVSMALKAKSSSSTATTNNHDDAVGRTGGTIRKRAYNDHDHTDRTEFTEYTDDYDDEFTEYTGYTGYTGYTDWEDDDSLGEIQHESDCAVGDLVGEDVEETLMSVGGCVHFYVPKFGF